MKKIIITLAGILLVGGIGFAQIKIDRSKKPKAGPAPIITFKDPATFVMPNGMTVLIVEDHKLPRVSASLVIDAGPVKEGAKAGVTDLMGQMLGEGTKNMSKTQFDEASDLIGANVNVYGGGGYAGALTRYFDKAFSLMADGLRNPSFPQPALDKLKEQTITGLKNVEKSAAAVADRTWNAISYGKQTAMGEFSTTETVKGITLSDIRESYSNLVTPSRSYLTFVGDITPAAARAMASKYFGNWTGKKLILPSIPTVNNPAKTEINMIDMPTAVQAQIAVGNLVNNPMNNPDYFALLLANQILGGGAESKLFMNLREKRGFTYGSYSSVGSGRFQSMFKATAQVRTDKADSAVAEIISEILAMRDGNITEEQLASAKAVYNGSFALGMEDPARSARLASTILINNLPKDYYRTYLQKINAVTVQDLKRVSKNYFSEGNSRIGIVGNADKIMPQLLRLGYAIKKYDIYGDPVIDAPKEINKEESVKTTDKVSAFSIVEDYLKAIGGKEEAKKITAIDRTIAMEMMGRSFEGSQKQLAPNKQVTEIKMMGQTVFKRSFNGINGFSQQGPQKKDLTMEEISEFNDDKSMIPQLSYTSANYKIEYLGAGKVDGEPTYRLKVVKPSGKTSVEQYSIKTGLLLQQESTTNAGGQEINQTTTFSDYRKTGTVLLPYKFVQSTGEQEVTISTTAIKLNEGVTEEDFK